MKKLISFFCLAFIVFVSCEGPEGLPGRDGFDGQNGLNGRDGEDGRNASEVATVYEIEQVNFNEDNNFGINFAFPNPLFDTDIVFVYRREAINNGRNVWEPLPTSTIYFDDNEDGVDDGYLEYRFNFTFDDVDILIESDDPIALSTDFLNNQVFRVVVAPAAFGTTKNSHKIKTLEELFTTYQIKESDVIKTTFQKN